MLKLTPFTSLSIPLEPMLVLGFCSVKGIRIIDIPGQDTIALHKCSTEIQTRDLEAKRQRSSVAPTTQPLTCIYTRIKLFYTWNTTCTFFCRSGARGAIKTASSTCFIASTFSSEKPVTDRAFFVRNTTAWCVRTSTPHPRVFWMGTILHTPPPVFTSGEGYFVS